MNMQKKKNLTLAACMLSSFFVVLALFFSPVFPGKVNGLNYLDNLFNMISKGSSYFIPKVTKDSDKYAGMMINSTITIGDEQRAIETAAQLAASGVSATAEGDKVTLNGDMNMILKSGLADADAMFKNDGATVADKYGIPEKQALFNWWKAYSLIDKDLTLQKKFDEGKIFANANKKAVEPAYNYYGVKTEQFKDNIWLVVGALAFYVIYTMWYGFGILYLFEGLGLKIGH
jgi:hypothetical protein